MDLIINAKKQIKQFFCPEQVYSEVSMKLSIKWFSVTALIIGTIPAAILFTWCALNGFGAEIVRIFESVYPSGGFSILENMDKPVVNRLPGIAINICYAAVDSFIAGFAFSSLYNLFVSKLSK